MKGIDECYARLFAAIYETAAEDSAKEVKRLIYKELRGMCVKKEDIQKYIDAHAESIENDVNKMVYIEAEKFPKVEKAETIRNQNKIRNKYVRLYFKG